MWRIGNTFPKQQRLGAVQPDVLVWILAKNLPDIRMDGDIIVYDEYPVAGFGRRGVHKFLPGGISGRIKVKAAPRPAPSLAAESEPPNSRALSAPR